MAFVPKPGMRKAVVASIRAVFGTPDRPEAERQLEIAVKKYRVSAPRLADWLEANIPEGLAVSPCRWGTGGVCGRLTCWSG